jgi:hypothetical protein
MEHKGETIFIFSGDEVHDCHLRPGQMCEGHLRQKCLIGMGIVVPEDYHEVIALEELSSK